MNDSKLNIKLIVMVAWLFILGCFSYWDELGTRHEERHRALTTANAFFQQVTITRQWNASHGGVYVPITTQTPQNEYLPDLARDLTTESGLKLTSINPSYMTRQLAELAQKNENGIQLHLTSLKPIRPENKATEWEERWLKSFHQGIKEQGEFFDDGNIIWFRYMAPLLTGPECLQCHAQQGYKEGDIRGGLSVSLPYPRHPHYHLLIGYGSVATIGLLLILLAGSLYDRKRRLFNATFDNAIPTNVTDKDHTILIANKSYWAEFGALPAGQKTIKCHDHRPGKSCHTENCQLTRIFGGSGQFSYETTKEKDGVLRHFIVTAKPLLDAKGKVVGSIESFQEITERKHNEEALEKLNSKLKALSNTDGLTGIANRRHFDEVLTREYTRHARSGAELSLILLDIDSFKLFNDSYGHVKGDECLQQIAQVIADCVGRPADLVARYGGEEFVCILPETARTSAVILAEKIRHAIMARNIPHQKSKIADCVTASLGVVSTQCTSNGSATDIVKQVDEQLYLSKSTGRNRVSVNAPSTFDKKTKDDLVKLNWENSFCCGNELIDSQHQSLVHVSNELLEAVLSGHPSTEISAIITRLLEDISQHFHDEQRLLEAIHFPGTSQHITEHDHLLAMGREMAVQFKASTMTIGDLFQFLAYEVVKNHLLESDREYFPFIKETSTVAPEEGKWG